MRNCYTGGEMATPTHVDIGSLIYSDPAFRGGRPCIAGTGMSVHAIAARYQRGESADEIAADLSDIPPSHVLAAVTYYLANQRVIDEELAAEESEESAMYGESKASR
jgi:uncharacterized protein (DUF433 family)